MSADANGKSCLALSTVSYVWECPICLMGSERLRPCDWRIGWFCDRAALPGKVTTLIEMISPYFVQRLAY